jgi:Arc/MetJ-type ribon-helix-helix transcriptional regulator
MTKENQADNKYHVELEFNQQQEFILKRLVEEGRYGKDYAEVIRYAFQEFLRQTRL